MENYNANPYTAQVIAQSREPSKAPAPKRTFPLTIGLRTYFSEEEFQKALNDFLAWKAHKQSKRARRKGG
jgi:hypothetical protein